MFPWACGSDEPPTLTGIVRDPAPDVAAVSLPDTSRGGEPFAMQARPGTVLVVYFGFTSCPDVCPTTMADLRTALRDLGDDAASVDVAMVTVDPGRDDGERLSDYVGSFVDGGHALRTDDDGQLRSAADAFGADYSVETADDGTVEVSHTAFLYAVDDRGQLRVQWPFGTPADDIGTDLHLLLRQEEP